MDRHGQIKWRGNVPGNENKEEKVANDIPYQWFIILLKKCIAPKTRQTDTFAFISLFYVCFKTNLNLLWMDFTLTIFVLCKSK